MNCNQNSGCQSCRPDPMPCQTCGGQRPMPNPPCREQRPMPSAPCGESRPIPNPPCREQRPMPNPLYGSCRTMQGPGTVTIVPNMTAGFERYPVGMGYVPMQNWEVPFPMERGFSRGTIFPSLDYPFVMGRCHR